jgi:hypothetical protein
MLVLVLALLSACPAWVPPASTSTGARAQAEACGALRECLSTLAQRADEAPGLPADLVLAQRAYRCGLAAETRAQANAAAFALVHPLPICPPATCPAVPECGVTLTEGLAGVGICALCAAPGAIAAAVCGGRP